MHPTDSLAWKNIDELWDKIREYFRNLRLAPGADGINPHSLLSSNYSCWSIILVNYNLPPWWYMKKKFMTLIVLISRSKQLGNDIDIYLAPLIDHLKTLWDGVEYYNSH